MDITRELKELNDNRDFELELTDYYQEGQTYDEFTTTVEEAIRNEEIIYYHKAIDYLKTNDASLNESLELADEMGFEVLSLNSEVLATLLYQRDLLEQLEDLQEEIEEIFEAVES